MITIPMNTFSPLEKRFPILEKSDEGAKESTRRQRGMVKWPSTKEKMTQIRRRSFLSEEQVKSLWLNYQDFCSLRGEATKVATKSKDKGYSKLLDRPLNDELLAQMKLDLWAKVENDLNLRGLERYVNTEHREWRDSARRQAVKAVLEAQKVAKETAELSEFWEYHLAAISCQHSADSKEFAQMMAKADEKAAKSPRIGADPHPSGRLII
jgi:hypothetical protein